MNQGLIPSRYAKALFEYASEHDCDKLVFERMQALSEAFASEPSLVKAVRNPYVSRRDKIQLLTTASGSTEGDSAMTRFMELLADNNRLDMARDIALAYLKIYRWEHNICLVTVTSAAPMAEAEEKRLKQLIQRHLGSAAMEYNHLINPDLIGGFQVSIDNEKLDASVANELKQLRLKLLN
ncbi:ATP synthase F1 subunit delta [Duncaniella freteri]|jgi:F-type H+-transporting ATPase subunit delta|uniref:ATP synthase F1 subunit delta n=1 Tax=Duncaniella freteri TaxID=2530391 RepID=UPI001368AB46|nr:ATP synthase F1 subunit delta [Duncaniella freteri]NBJ05758.1 ATP synthase F1 subunit delta [Alistipes sp. Z76]NCE67767.1 ATP synthase F1 subunit delta [Muribaculaceae bacterium M3]